MWWNQLWNEEEWFVGIRHIFCAVLEQNSCSRIPLKPKVCFTCCHLLIWRTSRDVISTQIWKYTLETPCPTSLLCWEWWVLWQVHSDNPNSSVAKIKESCSSHQKPSKKPFFLETVICINLSKCVLTRRLDEPGMKLEAGIATGPAGNTESNVGYDHKQVFNF